MSYNFTKLKRKSHRHSAKLTVTLKELKVVQQHELSETSLNYKSLGVFFALYEAQLFTSETIKASSESMNCLKWSLTIFAVLLSAKYCCLLNIGVR